MSHKKRIGKHIHYPIYDDSADFNTNAKSYYDYLARFNKHLRVMTDVVNGLLDKIEGLENEITNLGNTINQINNKITTLENKINSMEQNINLLSNKVDIFENSITKHENVLQKVINNLNTSGAITSNDLNTFTFKPDRTIASGNINVFGGVSDGNSFIRTSDSKKENDISAGY